MLASNSRVVQVHKLTIRLQQNVGPAIKTVDRLNGVSNPVGRMKVSPEILTASAGVRIEATWIVRSCVLGLALAYFL